MRDHRSPAQVIRDWRLPRPEREAAAAERRAERGLRRERDNQESAARRRRWKPKLAAASGGGAAAAEPSLIVGACIAKSTSLAEVSRCWPRARVRLSSGL
jgi:hypothetical protein